MGDSREGGCQCGGVRYRVDGEPLAVAACHCIECKRQSGSAFGMSMVIPRDSLVLLAGEPKVFTRPADSGGTVACAFCPTCGTRIYHEPSSMKGTVNVKPGTLDDTSWLQPVLHVYTRSRLPWVAIPAGVPTFETNAG